MATLFLVATPIGNLEEVSKRTIDTLNSVSVIACEDTRNSRKLFSHFGIHTKYITYHNFNEEESSKGIIKLLNDGEDVALISDAGYPLISDPGYVLVNEAINNGHKVVSVSGANAALNALVSSGLDTNHYLYYGFLNAKESHAKKELEQLKEFPYTMIFYEAPHRIEKTLKLCLSIFGDRKAVLARELTKLHETYHRGTLSDLCNLKNLKGEMVLLIDGNKQEEKEIDLKQLIKLVDKLIKKGYKTKDAVLEISEEHHCSKNALYNEYFKKINKESH